MRNRINERYQRQKQQEQNTANANNVAAKSAGAPGDSPQTAALNGTADSLEASVAALNPNHRIDRIRLPFLVISTNKKAVIDSNISNDKYVNFYLQLFHDR